MHRNSPSYQDVHLMVTHPEKWIDDMADAGTDIFTFHVEVEGDIMTIIDSVKQKGMKVGLAVKPGTSIDSVIPFIEKLDQVLVMTVEPGISYTQPEAFHFCFQIDIILFK